MSKFVEEIIKDITDNPTTWSNYSGQGVYKDEIYITQYGNGAILSLIRCYIKDSNVPITYKDRYKLEKAVTKWYKTINLSNLVK